MPVEKMNDPADVIEINFRLFQVEELYVDQIVDSLLQDRGIEKNRQTLDLILEARNVTEGNKPQVKESTMRVAAMIICEVIEKLDRFKDADEGEGDKRSVLVFLPGLHEIFEFIDFIKETYDEKWVRESFDLVPLHSSLCE
jgi:HrpA-like RNA helicase